MPLHLRPATPADIPAMADIYFSAFGKMPLAQHVFPASSPASHALWTSMFADDLADPRARIAVIVDSSSDSDSDHLIAFAKWVAPPPPGSAEPCVPSPPPKHIWPADGNPDFADEFFGGLVGKHREVMGDVRHWYLELVACREEDQGKGAGGMLLRWGCGMVDEDGDVAFLEATAGAKGLYERAGFVSVDWMEFVAPGGEKISQDFMVREGRAQGRS